MKMTEEMILKSLYGTWGDMRREYLRKTQPEEWQRMLEDGILDQYLQEYEETMYEWSEQMTEEICRRDNVTEELKKRDVMQWIHRYNNVLAEVRERLTEEIMPAVQEASV